MWVFCYLGIQPLAVDAVVMDPVAADNQKDDDDDGHDDPKQDRVILEQDVHAVAQSDKDDNEEDEAADDAAPLGADDKEDNHSDDHAESDACHDLAIAEELVGDISGCRDQEDTDDPLEDDGEDGCGDKRESPSNAHEQSDCGQDNTCDDGKFFHENNFLSSQATNSCARMCG